MVDQVAALITTLARRSEELMHLNAKLIAVQAEVALRDERIASLRSTLVEYESRVKRLEAQAEKERKSRSRPPGIGTSPPAPTAQSLLGALVARERTAPQLLGDEGAVRVPPLLAARAFLGGLVPGRLKDAVKARWWARVISDSSWFDAGYYRAENPDVKESGLDPVLHYVRCGASEGRNPHPKFNTGFYLDQNPDVAASGMNPLVHYLQFGAAEGRDPHEHFEVDSGSKPSSPAPSDSKTFRIDSPPKGASRAS